MRGTRRLDAFESHLGMRRNGYVHVLPTTPGGALGMAGWVERIATAVRMFAVMFRHGWHKTGMQQHMLLPARGLSQMRRAFIFESKGSQVCQSR